MQLFVFQFKPLVNVQGLPTDEQLISDFENKKLPFEKREMAAWNFANSLIGAKDEAAAIDGINRLLGAASTLGANNQKKAFFAAAIFIAENYGSSVQSETWDAISQSGADMRAIVNYLNEKKGLPITGSTSAEENKIEAPEIIPSTGEVNTYVDERFSPELIEKITYTGSVNFVPGIPSIANELRPFLERYVKSSYMSAYGVDETQFWNQAENAFGNLFNAQMAAKGEKVFGSSSNYDYSQICQDILKFLDANPAAGQQFLDRYFKDGAAARAALESGSAASVLEFFNLRNIEGASPCPLNGYFQNKLPEIQKTTDFDVKIFEVPFILSRNDLKDILLAAYMPDDGIPKFSFIPAAVTGSVSLFERRHVNQALSAEQDPDANLTESLPYTKQGTWPEYKAGTVFAIFIPKVPAFPIWVKPSLLISDKPDEKFGWNKMGWEMRASKRSPDLNISVDPISIFGEPGKGINFDFDMLARQKGGENVMGRTTLKLESPDFVKIDFLGIGPMTIGADVGYSGQFQAHIPAANMMFFVPKFMLGPGSLSAMYGSNFSGGDFWQLDAKIKIGDAFELFGGYQTVSKLSNILKDDIFDGKQDIVRVGLRYNLPLK